MSRFLGRSAAALEPYTPGEQPKDRKFIKLNTNECPYPPAPGVARAIAEMGAADCRLYPDPECKGLRTALAARHGLLPENVFVGNGSDEVLAFACMAFFDTGDKLYYPRPSYGFYPVYAALCGLEGCPVPLGEAFALRPEDYLGLDGHILIANPNAPTGLAIARGEVERILAANPDRLVMVDEAYADFGEDLSSLPLLARHSNLLVIGTSSKSLSMAGLRLGYAFGRPEEIAALERIKYSFNPYNVNRITQAAGKAAVEDEAHLREVTGKIKATRAWLTRELRQLGAKVLDSSTNFLFVALPGLLGREAARGLREQGILVRNFDDEVTRDYIRVSIGTNEEMNAFLQAVKSLI